MFYEKQFGFMCVLTSFCALYSGDADAICNRYNPVGAGKYCQHTVEYTCPENCYCTGVKKGEKCSITWASGVSKACKNRDPDITSELSNSRYGVYLCPEGMTSNKGASKKSDCFKKETTTTSGTATSGKTCNSNSKPAPTGSYCGALLTKKCKPGCYCKGGGNFTWAAGDVEKGCRDRWSKVTSELNSKGVYLCPDGYTSVEGAGSEGDCFLKGHSDIKYKKVSCDAGQYLPANASKCQSCKSNNSYLSYCPGGSWYPKSSAQGLKSCPSGQKMNADGTGCTTSDTGGSTGGNTGGGSTGGNTGGGSTGGSLQCSAGTYYSGGAKKCEPCPIRENGEKFFYCPGVSYTSGQTDDSGALQCREGIPSLDQTKCQKVTVNCLPGYMLKPLARACTACDPSWVCPGGDVTSSYQAEGYELCPDGKVPNEEHTACVDASSDSVICKNGEYLPAQQTTCVPCPESDATSATYYTCPGMTCKIGNEDCGLEKNTRKILKKDQLLSGEKSTSNALQDQCWIHTNPIEYINCVLGVAKEDQ